jgi:hypothetical protein
MSMRMSTLASVAALAGVLLGGAGIAVATPSLNDSVPPTLIGSVQTAIPTGNWLTPQNAASMRVHVARPRCRAYMCR